MEYTEEQLELFNEYSELLGLHDILLFSTAKFYFSPQRQYSDNEIQGKLRQLVLWKLSKMDEELAKNKTNYLDYIFGKYEKKLSEQQSLGYRLIEKNGILYYKEISKK